MPNGPKGAQEEFVAYLNRLAGTTGLEAAGAANALAGTTGLELVGALNAAAATTHLEMRGALDALANASGGGGAASTVTALSLPGAVGEYASTPTSPSITGDLDIRVKVTLSDWTPATNQCLFAKWPSAATKSYRLILFSAGTLNFYWTSDGSATFGSGSFAHGLADGATAWVRGTRVKSTGTDSIYISADGTAWTLLGSAVNLAGTAVYNGASAVEVGAMAGGTSLPAAGTFHVAEVRNGISGPVVMTFDPSGVAKLGTRNPTSFVSSTGETWTMNGLLWDWVEV